MFRAPPPLRGYLLPAASRGILMKSQWDLLPLYWWISFIRFYMFRTLRAVNVIFDIFLLWGHQRMGKTCAHKFFIFWDTLLTKVHNSEGSALITGCCCPQLGGVLLNENGLDPVVEVPHVKDATVLPALPALVLQAVVMARNLHSTQHIKNGCEAWLKMKRFSKSYIYKY